MSQTFAVELVLAYLLVKSGDDIVALHQAFRAYAYRIAENAETARKDLTAAEVVSALDNIFHTASRLKTSLDQG